MAPPRTTPSPPPAGRIPGTPATLVGRRRDLAGVERLLRTSRAVTITRPAGVGKTSLAAAVATRAAERGAPASFVDLGAVRGGASLAGPVADALGIREEPGRPRQATLLGHLEGKSGLLVLDNCEQVLDAAAGLVRELLGGCPGLSILATGREPLRIAGEARWPLRPLELAPEGAAGVGEVEAADAVQLFVARAQLVAPGFALDAGNAGTVAAICRRLEGIPLAIELCAARLALLGPPEILARLDRQLALLTSRSPTVPGRQRTLRAALDWSHELLSPSEQRLLRGLSVFNGSFSLTSATAVCGARDGVKSGADLLDELGMLVEKSLVERVEVEGGRSRYRLLEAQREYGLERLEVAGESEAVHRAHARHFLEHAQAVAAAPLDARAAADAGLAEEHANLSAALAWSSRHDVGLFVPLVMVVFECWHRAGRYEALRPWVALGVELVPGGGAEAVALLRAAGMVAWQMHDFAAARERLTEALRVARSGSDRRAVAAALGELGFVLFGAADAWEAGALFAEQLEIARELGDEVLVADALTNLAIADCHGDGRRAPELAAEAVRRFQAAGAEAEAAAPMGIWALGLILSGRLDEAESVVREAIRQRSRAHGRVMVATTLVYAAELAARQGRLVRAMRLDAMGGAICAEAGVALPSLPAASRARWIEGARRRLGARAAKLEAEAAAAGLEAAVAYALQDNDEAPLGPGAGGRERSPATSTPGLSARELAVVGLVAQGLTNGEVAHELGIARRTVDAHLEHVRDKLGVRNRAELAAWYARNRA